MATTIHSHGAVRSAGIYAGIRKTTTIATMAARAGRPMCCRCGVFMAHPIHSDS